MNRLLITGASGFLGQHCLAAAQAHGLSDIHCTSRIGRSLTPEGITWHTVDLRDPGAATQLISTLRPSHLLHAAWEATPVSYAASSENALWLNAGVAMVEAFGQCGGRRFVGVGTCAEYARSDVPCVEGITAIEPASAYASAKAAMAEALQDAAGRHGFSHGWGRVFLPYGPGDPPGRLLPMVLSALQGQRTVPLTDGLQQRDFIYAGDVGKQLMKLVLCDAVGPFNIGTGSPVTVRAMVESLAALVDGAHQLQFGAVPRRVGEAVSLVADMAHFHARVGLPPFTTKEEGLISYLASVARD